jgi:copper(I)-binding protein
MTASPSRRGALTAALALLGLALLLPWPAAAEGAVTVDGAWFRYLLPQVPAGGYMTLHNGGDRPAVLTAAASPACGTMMLHRSESSGGTERMVMVETVTVPAGGVLAFAPGGYHLMCMQPRMKPGHSVPVTLTFAGGQKESVSFRVYPGNATPESP